MRVASTTASHGAVKSVVMVMCFSSATSSYSSTTFASSEARELFSRFSFITPASASVMSMSAVSMVRTRSDSSTQSAKASRAAGSGVACTASSAAARRRVSGVRRSWVTLSNASRMPWISAWFLSSTRLNWRARSSSSVRRALAGTRADRLPVSMMARVVATTSRTGLVARWAKNAPPSTPSISVGVITIRKSRRNGWRRISRLLVLRPTCKADPSGNRIAATVKSRSSSFGMRNQASCDKPPPRSSAEVSN